MRAHLVSVLPPPVPGGACSVCAVPAGGLHWPSPGLTKNRERASLGSRASVSAASQTRLQRAPGVARFCAHWWQGCAPCARSLRPLARRKARGCSGRGGRMARASFHQGVIVDKRRDENTDCFIVVWCDTSRHIPSKRGVFGRDDWSSPRGLQNHRRETVMHPSPRFASCTLIIDGVPVGCRRNGTFSVTSNPFRLLSCRTFRAEIARSSTRQVQRDCGMSG